MCGLIEGLPDAVAIRCLARVPFFDHPKLRLVCRTWNQALRSSELFQARHEVSCTEDFLCALAFDPENVWQLYDPRRDKWFTLPKMPSQIRHLARFGAASVSGKLFVLGGGSDRVDPLTGDHDGIFATTDVWAFDLRTSLWAQRAPMLVPRAMFACCTINNRIVVAGGFTSFRKSISKAEVYDPDTDSWAPLPDLGLAHTSVCSGIVIKGRMHVLYKGLSTVQILQDGRWTAEDYGWLQGPMAVIKGEPYVLSGGLIQKQQKESSGNGGDKMVLSASEFKSRIGFGMIGLKDEIYMIGGVIGPGPANQSIKQLCDVDVLPVGIGGGKWPVWRQAAPMSRCCGSIFGCAVVNI